MYVLASTKELVPSENSGENVALEIFNQPRQVWIVLVELVKFGRRNTGEALLADRVLGLLLLEVERITYAPIVFKNKSYFDEYVVNACYYLVSIIKKISMLSCYC